MALHNVPLSYPDSDTHSEERDKPPFREASRPHRREPTRWMMGIVAVLFLGTLLGLNEYKDRRSLREATEQNSRLMSQVQFENVSLSNVSGWSRISGRIQNVSTYMLTGADLTVTVLDCVQGVCQTVGQNSLILNDLSVPAQQARSFERYIIFRGLPPPRGKYQWHYSVEKVRGY